MISLFYVGQRSSGSSVIPDWPVRPEEAPDWSAVYVRYASCSSLPAPPGRRLRISAGRERYAPHLCPDWLAWHTAHADWSNRYGTCCFLVGQIEHVFAAACQQKVWDHFSKAQRKNIELWKKQATVRN